MEGGEEPVVGFMDRVMNFRFTEKVRMEYLTSSETVLAFRK
jgi:hypothetical protein